MSTKLNLAQRIQAVMEEVTGVSKKGYNDFQNYAYAKEADYVEAIRPALIKHGIVINPSLVAYSRTENLTAIQMKFTLINVDDPKDTLESIVPGEGTDKGDKAVYKAVTGAKKYFIANQFMIPTNDDPEATESDGKATSVKTEYKASAPAAKAAPSAKPVAKAETIATEAPTTAAPAKSEKKLPSFNRKAVTNGTAKAAAPAKGGW